MFNIFQSQFKETFGLENLMVEMKKVPFKYTELLLACGGKTYEKGIYSIHTFESSVKWTKLLKGYFPKLDFDLICFGNDWMGRQYCVPIGIGEYIIILDPSDQGDYHIDTNLIQFHDDLIVNNKEDFFVIDYFKQILNYLNVEELPYGKCLGFKTSLFLGGEEIESNYSLCDLELYWDVENQLFLQVNGLADGKKINQVMINPFTDDGN